MDPSPLANTQWSDIGSLLYRIWLMVGLVVLMATNVLIGHIFIPSLVATFHLPSGIQKTRPAFYAIAATAAIAVVFVLIQVIGLADVLDTFWPDYWI